MRQWWSAYPGHDHLHISSVLPCLIMWFLWLERNDCTFGEAKFSSGHIIWRINQQLDRIISGGVLNSEHWRGVRVQHHLLAGRRPKEKIIRAARLGIKFASRHGENIWMETDAITIVQMITRDELGPAEIRHTICRVKHLIKEFNTKISYIAREGNKPADFLAEQGLEGQGLRVFDQYTAPTRLKALVEMEANGIPNFRFQTRWAEQGRQ
ncbi:hypothetical protein SASPL_111913 [Salvia splendens]|uniref:RNase H type-1 domain-containing protein n=1 Tax=Salvia splendens TaxID=180675 RepID=A0A8X9A2T6_SALSN|nr:hypothetical protein SASPL_111913 [Salvia splendens]